MGDLNELLKEQLQAQQQQLGMLLRAAVGQLDVDLINIKCVCICSHFKQFLGNADAPDKRKCM